MDNALTNDFADCEMAWSNLGGPARVFRHLWNGLLRDSDDPRLHPAQKPLALMKWVLNHKGLVDVDVVVDPFMGSGTTLRAAKDLGKTAIGIEIEEKYCEIAAKRLSQEIFARTKRFGWDVYGNEVYNDVEFAQRGSARR